IDKKLFHILFIWLLNKAINFLSKTKCLTLSFVVKSFIPNGIAHFLGLPGHHQRGASIFGGAHARYRRESCLCVHANAELGRIKRCVFLALFFGGYGFDALE